MTHSNRLARIAVLTAALGLLLVPAMSSAIGPDAYAEGGMKTCLKCHDETDDYPVLSILATKHAAKADERTPMAKSTECQTCHGPSAAHVQDLAEGEERPPVGIIFGDKAPAGPQNDVCLQCHQDTRAAIHKLSSHPLREGMIQCSDCHNAHGSMGPTNLVKPTLNETCYTCHAEKRGPFAWEHAPVAEDCTNCHTPHGSNHPSLLTARTPQLCQRCHAEGFHPSGAYGGPDYSAAFPGGTPVMDRRAGSKNCLNCHSEVHGTNHPSGSRLSR